MAKGHPPASERRSPSADRTPLTGLGARGALEVRLLEDELEPECAALARGALDADRAAHQLDELPTDREPEPRAAETARGAAVRLREALEDLGLALRRDADATATRTVACVGVSDARVSIVTEPASVNLMALPTRFISTWRTRTGSPWRRSGSRGSML